MSVVYYIVTLPMAKLCSFLHYHRAFYDIHAVGDATFFVMFSSVLLSPDTMRSAQILTQVLFPTFKTVDELIYTLLIKMRFALLLEPSRYEVRRPAEFQEPYDLFLESRRFDRIPYLAPFGFPLACLSLRGVGKVLPQCEVLVPFQLSADG